MSPVDDGTRKYAHPPTLDEAGLVAFLKTQPDLVAVYLFGSLVKGRAHPRSDIDIAVLLVAMDSEAAFDRRLRLMECLRPYADREVDVIVLNTAPPLLQHQVLKHGRLLYERNRLARAEFEVRAGKVYADLKPMRDFFPQALFKEIKEVGLGGRRRNRARASRVSAEHSELFEERT
jgi:predicted nucleotidyltransferase